MVDQHQGTLRYTSIGRNQHQKNHKNTKSMATIIASNIPVTSTEEKISEFFSFCGKIKQMEVVDKTEKLKTIKVQFEKASAVSTALLLNGAEFEGSQIEVVEAEGDKEATLARSENANDGAAADGDIEQEEKPKSAVIAELLAHGYVLQSSLVEKAVAFDQEHGLSDRFRNFISGLDEKYHLHDKNQQLADQTSSLYNQANSQWGIENRWNSGMRTLNTYLDKLKKEKYGSQVHDFYTKTAQDVKSVNEEALRLAELKKNQQEGQAPGASAQFPVINTITPEASTAAAASFVPLESEKK